VDTPRWVNSYLRRLLISGAQAVIAHSSRRKETAATWLGALIARKPRMVAAVASPTRQHG
jgi:transposase